MNVGDGFVVRVVVSAANESLGDDFDGGLGTLAAGAALGVAGGVVDFSSGGFAPNEGEATFGACATGDITAAAGACAAAVEEDGFEEDTEFGAEPWER